MTRFRRFALSFFLALAVAVLTLTMPRAAHAVAAALVQVTNTVSSPAITADVSKHSGQLVHLVAATNSSGARTSFAAVSTTGGPPTSPYTIPANQNLVITDIDLIPTSLCPGTVTTVNIGNGGFSDLKSWVIPGPTYNTVHFSYASGFVMAGGTTPNTVSFSNGGGCAAASVDLQGYLTSN